ncbi:MAG TPA: helix-turn-helix domain-containing protein, partial [Phenylobacterium sp.]|nr:helix-turn-helix domain-containing protein [Phenylobacterium sp.]
LQLQILVAAGDAGELQVGDHSALRLWRPSIAGSRPLAAIRPIIAIVTIMTRPIELDPYVVEVLMRDLVGHDHAPSAFLVYLWLWSRTEGGKRRFAASLAGIALETGLSKSSVQNAVRQLVNRRRLIAVTREGPTTPPVYEVLTPWARAPATA